MKTKYLTKRNGFFLGALVIIVGLIIGLIVSITPHQSAKGSHVQARSSQLAKKSQSKTAAPKKVQPVAVDWQKPSQTNAYPDIKQVADLKLKVSLAKQRVYVMAGDKVLYTMYASTGMADSTPKGQFIVRAKGQSFYNASEKMGANYWTGFTEDGLYLFHTVPTDAKGEYIRSETTQLGKKPSSHGCIRLSVPDAKWIFDTIPYGTQVEIV